LTQFSLDLPPQAAVKASCPASRRRKGASCPVAPGRRLRRRGRWLGPPAATRPL